MINRDLNKLLENSIYLSRGTRIQRLRKKPGKLLNSKIIESIACWFDKPIEVSTRTFWDEIMLVVLPEIVSLNIYRYGFYEEGLTRMIMEYLKPGMIFFDIGAHFGYFTLLSAALVEDIGQVHSFEPTFRTFNILKANVSNKGNVFINNNAVLSKDKIVIMKDYGIKYSAYNSFYNARVTKSTLKNIIYKKFEIESISIDSYVETNAVVPDFIKIDAESSEYEILLGMEKLIERHHPIITLEVGDKRIEGIPTTKEIINYILNKGYKPYEYKRRAIIPHVLKNEQYEYDNILFLPS